MAEYAVVVGNYEGAAVLQDCLTSVTGQTLPAAELIVVDASSKDRSPGIAAAAGATVLSAPNRGLGFLYNRGVEAATAEYVLLLNNDVGLDARCAELLAAELDVDDARFAADPTQLDWAGEQLIHGQTTIRRGALLREFIPGLHLDSAVSSEEVVPTVCANGAAMLVRRSMHLELGGFDETFFMEWEDLDLCWRGWLRDWPSVYVPDARVRHRVGAVTGASARPKRSASSHHNLVRWGLKCLPPAMAARVVLGEVMRLPRHPRAVAGGLTAVLPELPEILELRRSLAIDADRFAALVGLSER